MNWSNLSKPQKGFAIAAISVGGLVVLCLLGFFGYAGYNKLTENSNSIPIPPVTVFDTTGQAAFDAATAQAKADSLKKVAWMNKKYKISVPLEGGGDTTLNLSYDDQLDSLVYPKGTVQIVDSFISPRTKKLEYRVKVGKSIFPIKKEGFSLVDLGDGNEAFWFIRGETGKKKIGNRERINRYLAQKK